MREREQDLEEQEKELLGLYLMGDIREDAEVLGLRLKDMVWIVITTLLCGFIPFFFPMPILAKVIWLGIVFMVTTVGHIMRLPYRFKRLYYDKRYQKANGTGELLDDLLGMVEDSWFFKSKEGNVIQVLYEIKAPPWATSTLTNKRTRFNYFATFIRSCLKEKFRLDIFTEQVPDYQYEIWDRKKEQKTDSMGIEKLKHDRIAMWTQLARDGEAQRSVYILRLTIRMSDLAGKERDDEPADLNKVELKRYRMVAELREKQARVLSILEQSGHGYSLLSGYALTELLCRWWDPKAWKIWKEQRGDWTLDHESLAESLLVTAQQMAVATVEVDEGDLEQEAVTRKRSFSGLLRRSGSSVINFIRRLWDWFKTVFKKRNKEKDEQAKLQSGDHAHEAQEETAATDDVDQTIRQAEVTSKKPWLISAPASTGKSFLCVNVAVAMSSYDHPVHVVDLSPDQGCKTLLNPLPITSGQEGWNAYIAKHAPGLTLWLPDQGNRPDHQAIMTLIEQLAQSAATIVDVPWHYPNREELFEHGEPIAVVDSDYHHWLQWEQEVKQWQDTVWLNHMDKEMETIYRSLLMEHGWSPSEYHVFPEIAKARYWMYQGVPAASMAKEHFHVRQTEGLKEEIA